MAKAVIFDRDGVIIDSEKAHKASVTAAFEKLGIRINDADREQIVGKYPTEYLKYFLSKYSFSPEEFNKIHEKTYFELLYKSEIIQPTVNLVKKLHNAGVITAVTTTSHMHDTMIILKRAGIEKMFNVIVTYEDVSKRKPDPEPYLITAKKLNLSPDECVVIEDTEIGLTSAKSAGMKCIVIKNEYSKNHDFSKADMTINSADDLTVEMLKKM
jgi:HAD superfamily hydrolase (TIGR01509 family)